MTSIRLIMRCVNNCPQQIKAFTDDSKAMDYLDELASEYCGPAWDNLVEKERDKIFDEVIYELEAQDGSLITASFLVVDA